MTGTVEAAAADRSRPAGGSVVSTGIGALSGLPAPRFERAGEPFERAFKWVEGERRREIVQAAHYAAGHGLP